MIEVRHLTKKYGKHVAVDDLSFTIEKGVIYGFLGPNGAGKSTTMNMITGCLGCTEGEVLIDGHSITEEPLSAKKLMGYLPEIPPVYPDMTAEEYLRFIMRAKKIPAGEREAQLSYVMEKTKITSIQKRLIKNLSKGYRQRVGIAQALIGNPEVIILDEPTVGLDPAQIIEIRELIRELGQDHTIVLSSHILSEVQAVCDSIMIISKGKLVASDTAENLTKLFATKSTIKLTVKGTQEAAEAVLATVEGIEKIDWLPKTEEATANAELHLLQEADPREAIFLAFSEAKLPLLEMTPIKASLEDIFLELTGEDAPTENSLKENPAEEKAPANQGSDASQNAEKEATAE